ncbi:MAG: Tat pathway signal protein, partial [Alphaproteobacteria bacterium]
MQRRVLILGGAAGALATAGVLGWRSLVGSAAGYDRYAGDLRAPLGEDATIADLVRCATLAANSHNTQPWRFRAGTNRIEILPDFARRTPAVDPDDHHLFASLGCAAENLLVAATATGRPGYLEVDPAGRGVAYA